MRYAHGQLALIDFGTAREVTQTFMQKLAGQQVTGIVSYHVLVKPSSCDPVKSIVSDIFIHGNRPDMISPGYTPVEQINGKAVPPSDFFALAGNCLSSS